MLTNTFLHIPYVNETTEKKLWQKNIRNWDDFLGSGIACPNCDLIKKQLTLSKQSYEKKDYGFFASKLLKKFHWRAYDDFRDSCCFLDIETTGLDKNSDDITVIGLYDGKASKVFINGQNMDEFREEIKKYSFIVSFNGYLFDLPFIQEKFPGLELNQFHSDLRFLMKNLGYSGGLKSIEKQMGIERESDLNGLTGRDAVKLWRRYKKFDDTQALDKLVRYNIEDIENLKVLMDYSYDKLKESCFTNSYL